MKKFLIAAALTLVAAVCVSDNASAQQPCGFGGFAPFGFYQPYGARYGTSLRTPPYFATNPPVYYGARYARPYGISPFAAPPSVSAPASYRARLRTQFQTSATVNPYIIQSAHVKPEAATVAKKGDVQQNPFVDQADHLVVH